MITYSSLGVVWYAMKTTYKRELKAKEYLDSRGIENFIPMQQHITSKYGRRIVTTKPAIHNLIFVKVDLSQLKDIKASLGYIHNCLTDKDNITSPIIVPFQQMEQFIDVTTKHLDQIAYVDLTTTTLKKGTPVRIIDGRFKGYEGELERIKGKRNRRVHVNIKGITAYSFEVEADLIEVIDLETV
ncbi:MAG: UpxY family transcription antiterminator [Rikenellaceae bacterium]